MKFIQYTFDSSDDLVFVIDTGNKVTYTNTKNKVMDVSHINNITNLSHIFKYSNLNKLMETIYEHSFQDYTGQWAREYFASYDD